MAIVVELLEHRDAEVWDDFVSSNRTCTPFHSTRWKRVVQSVYGHQAYYLFARAGGAIRGILPLFLIGSRLMGRTLVSLPYVGTQPSCCSLDRDAERALFDAAAALAVEIKAKTVEVREIEEKPWDWFVKSTYVNIQLPLTSDPDEVWRLRLDSRVRTKVRAATKRGLSVLWGGQEHLDMFYELYLDTMHRLGSPPHRRSFFRETLDTFAEQASILLVADGDRPAAAAIVVQDQDWIGFPWAASSSQMRAKHPNNLLYWSLIEKACHEGFDSLDMGRSPVGSGTLHFKKQWGGVVRPLWYYFSSAGGEPRVSLDASDPFMKLASGLWRRLPVSLANRFGPSVARLLP